ncbi:diacylglycerol/lipid kinase family protein [Nocardioides sp. P5_C9_2]
MTQVLDAPSSRRRWAAIASLATTAVLVGAVVLMLLRHPGLLVGGLVGLALAVAGGWWALTERMPRRAVGLGGTVLGGVVLAVAVVRSVSQAEDAVLKLLLLAALVAIAAATARLAMLRDPLGPGARPAEVTTRPRKPVLLCNPWSGGGKVERFGLAQLAADLGVETVFLDHGVDLAQLALDAIAGGADCLGMAGGDGSQALVASIAIEHDLPFVCISAGTRNHFALDLGLDREDPRTGMVAFLDGVERRVDYATVGDRLFVNNVSLGVYATIVQEEGYRDAKTQTSRQLLPELLGREAEPFDLQFTRPDGVEVDGAFLVLVSNNPYVLGPALDISQRRSMETGVLGVVAVTARTGREAAAMVARSTAGLGGRDPHIHQFTATSFEIRSHSGKVFAGVDGESLELASPLTFAIHPRGLRLRVPVASLEVAARRDAHGFDLGDLVDVARGRPPSHHHGIEGTT